MSKEKDEKVLEAGNQDLSVAGSLDKASRVKITTAMLRQCFSALPLSKDFASKTVAKMLLSKARVDMLTLLKNRLLQKMND